MSELDPGVRKPSGVTEPSGGYSGFHLDVSSAAVGIRDGDVVEVADVVDFDAYRCYSGIG